MLNENVIYCLLIFALNAFAFAFECGTCAPRFSARVSHADFSFSYSSDHFVCYYETSGVDRADFSLITNAAAYLEFSFIKETRDYKYPVPTNIARGEKLPVYFQNLGTNVLGLADTSGDSAFITINSTIMDFTNSPPQILLSTTCAHELFHTIQFTYGRKESWWMEGSAVWMENEVFPSANTYVLLSNRLKRFFEHPEISLKNRTYDACIIPLYISTTRKPDVIRRIWKKCRKNHAINALKKCVGNLNKFYSKLAFDCYHKSFAPLELLPDIKISDTLNSPTNFLSDNLGYCAFQLCEVSNSSAQKSKIEICSNDKISAALFGNNQKKRKMKCNKKCAQLKTKSQFSLLTVIFTKQQTNIFTNYNLNFYKIK